MDNTARGPIMNKSIAGLSLVILVFVLLGSSGTRTVQSADANLPSLRIGLSTLVMEPDVNTDDALAAARVWAARMGGASWKAADSVVLPDIERAEELVSRGQVDLVALGTNEYIPNPAKISAKPSMAYMINGDVNVEYVLLVRRDSKIETARDLDGKRVAYSNRGRHCLVPTWLDTFLMKNRSAGKEISLRERKVVNKTTHAILPVFFNQMDAAIVVRSAFDTAAVMNPQIGKQLKVLASSPPLVPVIVLMRDSMPSLQKTTVFERALKLHELPEGLQTFTMFKIDRIVAWQKGYESNIRQLLDEYEKLKRVM